MKMETKKRQLQELGEGEDGLVSGTKVAVVERLLACFGGEYEVEMRGGAAGSANNAFHCELSSSPKKASTSMRFWRSCRFEFSDIGVFKKR